MSEYKFLRCAFVHPHASSTTRVFKNLKFSNADYFEMALASENSKFSLANSHLPKMLASGGLVVRSHLPARCKKGLQSICEHV